MMADKYQGIDIPNANKLIYDSDVDLNACGCSGADGDSWSSSDSISPELGQILLNSVTSNESDDKFDFSIENIQRILGKISGFIKKNPELANKVNSYLKSSNFRKERIANCGRMPIKALFDSTEKAKYRACVEAFLNRKFQNEFQTYRTPSGGSAPAPTSSGKILGMSPITFAVVAVGVLGVSAYFIFRKR